MLEKLITQLGKDLGMDGQIAKTEERHFLIPLDEGIEVEAVELEKSHLLKAVVAEWPAENGEAFFLKAMEANLFGMGTRGAVIGMNEEGKVLTLSMELDYNSSFKDFKEKLEDFVSVLDFWRKAALKDE